MSAPELDQLARAMKDHEKRLNRVEAFIEKHGAALDAQFELDRLKGNLFEALSTGDWNKLRSSKPLFEEQTDVSQFCPCGKDRLLCRAPECPSHKRPTAAAPQELPTTELCRCGELHRHCEAPQCASHKPDPMGR